MSTALLRGLQVLEFLAGQHDGVPLSQIADALGVQPSSCHRIVGELVAQGYVRQAARRGDYAMTTRLAALGLAHLSNSGIVDIAQPVLERLAGEFGELVRLSLVDGERLTWVAKVEGLRKGFRYDPDMGMDARLSCTASGHAWLMTLSDEEALGLVLRQGFGAPREYGPRAPTSVKSLLGFLHAARVRGYAIIDEVFAPGMAALAAPLRRGTRPAIGVLSIAGPRTRLSLARMQQCGPALVEAAGELVRLTSDAGHFSRPPLGKA